MKGKNTKKMLLPYHQQKTSFHRGIFRNVSVALLRLFHIVPYFPKKTFNSLMWYASGNWNYEMVRSSHAQDFSFSVPVFIENSNSEKLHKYFRNSPAIEYFQCQYSSSKTLLKCDSLLDFLLTSSWRRSLSYTNQSIYLLFKSMDWFLYDRDLRHEWVKLHLPYPKIQWRQNKSKCHQIL